MRNQYFSDTSVESVVGLLNISSLQELNVEQYGLSRVGWQGNTKEE
jgi:hypothetical protein